MDSFYNWHKWSLSLEGVSRVTVFFKIWKFEFLANFWNFSALTLKNKSTVLDGFFPYLSQMNTSMRGCVAYNDLWPRPISSRSFGLGLENRVRSVASTVPDGFFPYLVQMITSIRKCIPCDDLWPWPISSRSFDLDFENFSAFTLEKKLQFCLHSFHIWHKSSLASEGVSHVMTFDLDLYFQGHSALTLKIVSAL